MNNSTGASRSALGFLPGQATPRIYDRVVEILRTRHYSRRTEKAYLHWIRHFLNRFLTHLAVQKNVAAPPRTRLWRRFCSFMSTCWNNR